MYCSVLTAACVLPPVYCCVSCVLSQGEEKRRRTALREARIAFLEEEVPALVARRVDLDTIRCVLGGREGVSQGGGRPCVLSAGVLGSAVCALDFAVSLNAHVHNTAVCLSRTPPGHSRHSSLSILSCPTHKPPFSFINITVKVTVNITTPLQEEAV